jgi:formyl-CoA transferase
MVVDLKSKTGKEIFFKLVERSDVVVHNFRPKVPLSLGIDYESLRSVRPDLIYCSLTGFGNDGPLKDHPGFDQLLQAFTGIAWFQGDSTEGDPQLVTGSIVDYYASSLLALGVTGAIVHRLRTGQGQRVDISLLQAALAMQAGRFVWSESEEKSVSRELSAGKVTGIHPTKDGHIYIQAHSPPFWSALCEFLEMPEFASDQRYSDMKKRKLLAHEIVPKMHSALAHRSAEEWEALMLGKVPCIAVRKIEDMFDHPQVKSAGLVTTLEHPSIGHYRALRGAITTENSKQTETTRSPMMGEHTKQVLEELGYPEKTIEEFFRSKAVA